MPTFEDEHGTYIMNSRDLRAIQHVEQLIKMGVHSLKIEGRTKSHYYVARTTQAYRKAIDDAIRGDSFDKGLMDVLENIDRKSTRLNSSHVRISYAVFCLKKKT